VRGWWVVVMLGAVGCGEPVVVPASLESVSGSDGQSAPAGGLLPRPLVVTARLSDGSPAPRAAVRWTVTGGNGATLSDSVTVSDGDGRAQVAMRLGPTVGTYSARGELVRAANKAVSFRATATAPPFVSAVVPSQFAGGDTVTVQGSGFEVGVLVTIGGAPARVLAVGGANTMSVTVPVCLPAGSVAVRVWVRTAPSNSFSATYAASTGAIRLAVGDYAAVHPSQVTGCATFPQAGSDTVMYLLAPQATTGVPGDSALFRLVGDSTLAAVPLTQAGTEVLPLAVRFHDHLRSLEAGYAGLARPPSLLRAPQVALAAPTVGSQRTFHVCATVDCSLPPDFATVTATLRYVGQHAAIYQDNAAPSGGFSDLDFQALGQLFDDDLYEVDTQAFGAESDVDNNGLVFILFTPTVNKLTPKNQCSQSFVTGFFFNADIDPAFVNDTRSNQAEVFYAIVPDPSGSTSCSFSASSVKRLVSVTFIHEFQHMISYYHHVLLSGGGTETLWLNEAMSHLAEELGGWHFLAQGDTVRFSDFALGDLFNAYKYLETPSAFHVLFASGTGTLEERGAAWLFLRWVVDQFGDAGQNGYDLTRRLEETPLRGAANIESATGDSLSRMLPQWFLASYVSDLPGFTPPPRLTFARWAFRTTYSGLHLQAPSSFPQPFPLVPPSFEGGTFNRSGVLRAGSGAYLIVVQDPLQHGFGVRFTNGSGGPLPDSLRARLDVVRIR
jgi:hypothetical protein